MDFFEAQADIVDKVADTAIMVMDASSVPTSLRVVGLMMLVQHLDTPFVRMRNEQQIVTGRVVGRPGATVNLGRALQLGDFCQHNKLAVSKFLTLVTLSLKPTLVRDRNDCVTVDGEALTWSGF